MARRVTLPLTDDKRMSLAHAREKLGGGVSSHGDAGTVVAVGHDQGVIVWSDETSCDVALAGDLVRRVKREEAVTISGAAALRQVARNIRSFASLATGDTTTVDGHTVTIVEKCRWGALVARSDGRIFAVGFRRLAREPN